MTKRITFTDVLEVDHQFAPVPATEALPKWYKENAEYVNGKREVVDAATPATVKKCIPVFDAMTAGYILRTYVDVQVTQHDGAPYYQWPSLNPVGFHPIEQAAHHPANNGAPYPKWYSPWAIRTEPGYSCLFVPPMHNPNGIFTILPGIVDTDTYLGPVNFPFVLNDVRWEGIIPAGTPMAQVIPFRRESFRMVMGGDDERKQQQRNVTRLRTYWFNSYKRQFWSRKTFR